MAVTQASQHDAGDWYSLRRALAYAAMTIPREPVSCKQMRCLFPGAKRTNDEALAGFAEVTTPRLCEWRDVAGSFSRAVCRARCARALRVVAAAYRA